MKRKANNIATIRLVFLFQRNFIYQFVFNPTHKAAQSHEAHAFTPAAPVSDTQMDLRAASSFVLIIYAKCYT